MRFHSSKVEFVCSFFGGNVGLKKSFRLCLTFSHLLNFSQNQISDISIIGLISIEIKLNLHYDNLEKDLF